MSISYDKLLMSHWDNMPRFCKINAWFSKFVQSSLGWLYRNGVCRDCSFRSGCHNLPHDAYMWVAGLHKGFAVLAIFAG